MKWWHRITELGEREPPDMLSGAKYLQNGSVVEVEDNQKNETIANEAVIPDDTIETPMDEDEPVDKLNDSLNSVLATPLEPDSLDVDLTEIKSVPSSQNEEVSG